MRLLARLAILVALTVAVGLVGVGQATSATSLPPPSVPYDDHQGSFPPCNTSTDGWRYTPDPLRGDTWECRHVRVPGTDVWIWEWVYIGVCPGKTGLWR
jgi:hypothetical protein